MSKRLVFGGLVFLFLVFFSLYLLVISRAGETHTVWEFMNPLFMPVFLALTLILAAMVFSPEGVRVKLVFVMLYCFVSVSFFAVVFPAGTLGSQQSVLGITQRLFFDGSVLHGWGGNVGDVFLRAYNWLSKPNFQSAFTMVFARMFGVDVFWVHLFLLPVLWGVFVPLIAFLVARTLKLSDRVAVLSGFFASAFPLLVFSGSISVPSSLGYVFFFGTLLFCLRYLVSGRSAALWWMVVLAFASFVSHFLTGILSVGFIVLVLALRRYEREKAGSGFVARYFLAVSFVVAVSLLPLALRFLQLVSVEFEVDFSLSNLQGLSVPEVVGLFFFGEYVNYSPWYALINLAGPLLGLAGVVYALLVSRGRDSFFGGRGVVLFLFLGFLVTFVDYTVLNMFMVNVPFSPRRVWVFMDLTLLPSAAFAVFGMVGFAWNKVSGVNVKLSGFSVRRVLSGGLGVLMLILLGGWIVASVFSAYPSFGPLQITSYELDAVRYLETASTGNYVVIGDQFVSLAGAMVVGVANPRAFYVSSSAFGLELFNEMKANPSVDVMVVAMSYTNASVAYFVVDKPRLDAGEFDRVVSAALNNGLQMLPVSFGDGKVVIFRYERL